MKMLRIFLVILACMLFQFSYGQRSFDLSGRVLNEENEPLVGATVRLSPLNKTTVTDEQGVYLFSQLPQGEYELTVLFISYQSVSDIIVLDENKTHTVHLVDKSYDIEEVEIIHNHAVERKKEETLNIEIVDNEYLKKNLGGSLMNSIEKLPGVTTIDIGSGQSKPVIRGLGFNRVVVVENNIKHEAQQWGADHGLEVDQYAVENIEVIKGPASLMYGSDAIGGVIDMESRSVPESNTFGGSVDLSGKTNNDFLGTSVSLYGRKKALFARARATILDYGDYKVPTDSVDIYSFRAPLSNNHLRNTAGEEQDLHFTVGIVKQYFQSEVNISNIKSKNGFFANAHGLEPRNIDEEYHDKSNRDIHYPFQKVNHFKAINTSRFQTERSELEVNLGFQHNLREEWSQYVQHGYMPAVFPNSLSFPSDLEREFDKYVLSGNTKFHYDLSDDRLLDVGLNSEYQKNKIDGRGFIIPAYQQFTIGGFLLVKQNLSENDFLQAGVRYDYGNVDIEAYSDWFSSPVVENGTTVQEYLQRAANVNRDFSNFTWSAGYQHDSDNWNYRANVGKSFRMPIAKELGTNGVNYHRFSYEVGDIDLSPEISYQVDAGVEYKTDQLNMGASPFFNYFTNYIYLNPTSNYDRLYGNGNQVFNYTESEVLRYGAELHTAYQITNELELGFVGEYVYSEQMSGAKKGFTLPFSPPASGIVSANYQKEHLSFADKIYLSADFKIVAAQNDIVPPEETTDGYQNLDIGLGGDFSIKNQKISTTLQVRNVLDSKYFNHTNYYRLINVPEAGRNVIVNISVPFSGKIK